MVKDFFIKYKRFEKYIAVSIVTTVVNVVSFMMFVKIFKDMYVLSNILSWIISILITFVLNKVIVFQKRSDRKREVFKELVLFYFVRLSSLFIDTLVLCLCKEVFGFSDIVSKIISNVSTTFNNYFISKYFVFKEQKK